MPAKPKSGPSKLRTFEEVRAEPACFWIRHSPRIWAGPDQAFLDLSRGVLASARLRAGMPAGLDSSGEALAKLKDAVYLPPAAAGAQQTRRELFEHLCTLGLPVVVQVLPGEPDEVLSAGAAVVKKPNVAVILDLSDALLTGELGQLETLGAIENPQSTGAVWPLIPGRTDPEALWQQGLKRLQDRVSWVQPIVPALSTEDRRLLAEGADKATFQALFHGEDPDVRSFARYAAALGFDLVGPRPIPQTGGRRQRNRALAGHLATIGELWLLAGRSESSSQSFFRAARWVEAEEHDISRLALEGNLGVIDWLEHEPRQAIETWEGDPAKLIRELMNELGAEPTP